MNDNLAGKLLLAMPNVGDPRFDHAVIFVCSHDEHGAMGLVINHALPGISFADMLEHVGIQSDIQINLSNLPVLDGGPIDGARGFLLHSSEYHKDDTVVVSNDYSITGTIEALREVVSGQGPDRMLFILGYAGWDAGQLDQELQDNVWLVVDADTALIFETPMEQQWNGALGRLGVDPAMLTSLSTGVGHA